MIGSNIRLFTFLSFPRNLSSTMIGERESSFSKDGFPINPLIKPGDGDDIRVVYLIKLVSCI
jgi:hypothetical protein